MAATITEPNQLQDAVLATESVLNRMASDQLPPELDQRILSLAERKESLSGVERSDLFAWVAFTHNRSLEKWEAETALRKIR